jgi:hypothetical protein
MLLFAIGEGEIGGAVPVSLGWGWRGEYGGVGINILRIGEHLR